ncbi:MAG: SMP-30/gluconolactonase/LRE family protein [Alphaproteobacteria bacterium]|nr:SMP-30/gluconolactonase/LRE family protein [Alphaproteobacteria bacterium]
MTAGTDAPDIICLDPANAILGEGPVWDAAENALWWVDIKRPELRRYDATTGAVETWRAPERIGCVIPTRTPRRFIAGLKSGLAVVKPAEDGALSVDYVARPDAEHPTNRFNDGKADPAGRLWVGGMDDEERDATGYLYRVMPDLSYAAMDGPYAVTNGPAISGDGRVLYHTDTLGRTIWRFDLGSDGALANKSRFVVFDDPGWGHPDGSTVDAAGFLWVAHWGGGRVTRFTPDGTLDRVIPVPARQVTSCVFGGPDLRDLYITSAAVGLPDPADGIDGALFRCRPGPQGVPVARFLG